MTETVQLIDTLFWNTRLFGYILNVLDIIRKMGFQYYFPHRTSHPGALHLTIKLPDEQSCPPPLAFFCKLRGTAPEPLRSRPKTHRRCALAVWKIAYQRGVLTGARRSYVLESEGLKSRSISKISKIRWIACWWFKGERLRAGRKM